MLQLGSPEALGGEGMQLVSGDDEVLPPPPNLRALRAERRQAQQKLARIFARQQPCPVVRFK